MTTSDNASRLGDALLALVDEVVTHRVDVLTDSDWFLQLVADAVADRVRAERERPGSWRV